MARPSAGFGQMAPRLAPLFSTRCRVPGAGFTGNGAFQCFRVLGVPNAHLGRKWPRPGPARWVQVRGPEGCSGLRVSTSASSPEGRTSGGAFVSLLRGEQYNLALSRGQPLGVPEADPRASGHAVPVLSGWLQFGGLPLGYPVSVIASYASTSSGRSISCRRMPASGLSPGSGRA